MSEGKDDPYKDSSDGLKQPRIVWFRYGLQQPFENIFAQRRRVRAGLNAPICMAEGESFAIRRAVKDAGVSLAFAKLFPCLAKGVVACAGQFLLPTDDACLGKPASHP